MSDVVRYIVIYKKESTEPRWDMEEGWLSISILARSSEEAKRWAAHRIDTLLPWLNCKLEFVRAEKYKPTPERAGPYRGLIWRVE